MVSTNSHVFSEVELVETFLKSSRAGGFRVVQLGMCQGIRHPRFGLDVYPASIFTTATRAQIESALTEAGLTITCE